MKFGVHAQVSFVLCARIPNLRSERQQFQQEIQELHDGDSEVIMQSDEDNVENDDDGDEDGSDEPPAKIPRATRTELPPCPMTHNGV
jgi:hypothetical protein